MRWALRIGSQRKPCCRIRRSSSTRSTFSLPIDTLIAMTHSEAWLTNTSASADRTRSTAASGRASRRALLWAKQSPLPPPAPPPAVAAKAEFWLDGCSPVPTGNRLEPLRGDRHGQHSLRINAIVKGRRAITADTDLRLCRFFGLTEGFWLRMQAGHDLKQAKQSLESVLPTTRPNWCDWKPGPI